MSKRSIIFFILLVFILFNTSNTYSSSKGDYELQEKCGKRCEEFFKKEHGNAFIDIDIISATFSYNNHFNNKLKKCFILLTTNGFMKDKTGKTRDKEGNIYEKVKFKTLKDINENKVFGSLIVTSKSFIHCEVMLNYCNSEEEWDLLVKPYMEE